MGFFDKLKSGLTKTKNALLFKNEKQKKKILQLQQQKLCRKTNFINLNY